MQQTINGIAVGAVYALLGLGVTLVWGVLRVLNFAHAQILTWGAFATLLALHWGWAVPFAFLFGVAVAGALSVVLDATIIEALRRRSAPEFAFVVATIGIALILETVLKWRTNSQVVGFDRSGFPEGGFDVAGVNVPALQLLILAVSLAVMVLLGLWLRGTRLGRAVRTVAYSRTTAELLGVNTRLVFAVCFLVSGALAATAGIFVAASTSTVSYSSGAPLLLVAFAVIVVGGMGSVTGAIVGGLAIGLIEVYATVYISSVFREAVAFILLFLVLTLRPSGLFGEAEATRV